MFLSYDNPGTLDYSEVEAYDQLLRDLDEVHNDSEFTSESFQEFRSAFTGSIPTDAQDYEKLRFDELISASMKLGSHVYDALLHEPKYFTALLSTLAIATREEQIWRSFFGIFYSVEDASDQVLGSDPDSVLEVARRVITLNYLVSSDSITDALKIIANCCADDGLNRGLIVRRNGIESLLRLCQHGTNLDTLIPTLYNVCAECHELTESVEAYIQSTGSMPEFASAGRDIQTSSSDPNPLSLAMERLALCYRSECSFTTFELLLSLYPNLSMDLRMYLADVVGMATSPAVNGFENIRSNEKERDEPWGWSFKIKDETYDTIALMRGLCVQDTHCLGPIVSAALHLLSQPTAIQALLKREPDSIWALLTLPSLYEEELDDRDPLLIRYTEERRAFLKLFYQITGDPAFCQNIEQAPAFIERCITSLQAGVGHRGPRPTQNGQTTAISFLQAAAGIVLAQLAAVNDVRTLLLQNSTLISTLVDLLNSETNPDVLYPAISIVSRVALAPNLDLPLVEAGILESMQRLLTEKGLGMIVPVETVVAYKNILRGRINVFNTLACAEGKDQTIVDDILILWDLAMDDGTRLEIGKFFLEALRTILPAMQQQSNQTHAELVKVQDCASKFLRSSSIKIANIFAWVCLKAEPQPQRDHGWFAFAMLCIWPEARQGVLKVLDQKEDLRDAILKISQGEESPVSKNLMLMLSKLQSEPQDIVTEATRITLKTAIQNLGLASSNDQDGQIL